MPMKFKKDERILDRRTKKVSIVKHYMKLQPLAELMAYINNDNGKRKVKQKCRNEVVRRGYRIEKVAI